MSHLNTLKLHAFNASNANQFLNGLNVNQMQDLVFQIDAECYWNKRNPSWYKGASRKLMAWLRKIQKAAKKRIKTGRVQEQYSSHGSVVSYSSMGFLDGPATYEKHFLTSKTELWHCLYGDAYSAAWVNIGDRKIVTYAEGDVTTYVSPSHEIFMDELGELREWAEDQGYTVSVSPIGFK